MVYDLIFMSLITVQNLTNECFRTLLNRFGSNQVWTGLVWSGQQELGQHAKRFVRMLKIWPKDGPGMPMSKWQKMSPGRKWDKMSTGTKYRWEKMFPNHFCHRKKTVFGRNQSFWQNHRDSTKNVNVSYRDEGTWNTQIQAQILVEIQIITWVDIF